MRLDTVLVQNHSHNIISVSQHKGDEPKSILNDNGLVKCSSALNIWRVQRLGTRADQSLRIAGCLEYLVLRVCCHQIDLGTTVLELLPSGAYFASPISQRFRKASVFLSFHLLPNVLRWFGKLTKFRSWFAHGLTLQYFPPILILWNENSLIAACFLTSTCTLSGQNDRKTILNLKIFHRQIIANLP